MVTETLVKSPASYQVQTPDFAGPMDIMVFLVRRRELDVAYISLSSITQDFLDWVSRMETADLDIAGDFILLAATLLQFKLNNLLPGGTVDQSDAEYVERERVHSEEELESLRETVARMTELEDKQINLFDRGSVSLAGVDEELTSEMVSDVSTLDLALAFRDVIYQLPEEATFQVESIPYTLEGQMAFVRTFIGERKRVLFSELAHALESRLAVIMTFLAVLEMIRTSNLRVVQRRQFESIWLISIDPATDILN